MGVRGLGGIGGAGDGFCVRSAGVVCFDGYRVVISATMAEGLHQ